MYTYYISTYYICMYTYYINKCYICTFENINILILYTKINTILYLMKKDIALICVSNQYIIYIYIYIYIYIRMYLYKSI